MLIAAKVLGRARSRIQPRRTLRPKMGRKTGLLRLLRRGSQSWTALVVSCHDASEQIAWAMANRRRLGLRGAVVLRVLTGTTASFKLALQTRDLVLVPV